MSQIKVGLRYCGGLQCQKKVETYPTKDIAFNLDTYTVMYHVFEWFYMFLLAVPGQPVNGMDHYDVEIGGTRANGDGEVHHEADNSFETVLSSQAMSISESVNDYGIHEEYNNVEVTDLLAFFINCNHICSIHLNRSIFFVWLRKNAQIKLVIKLV